MKIPYPNGMRGNTEWENTFRTTYLRALETGHDEEKSKLIATETWYKTSLLNPQKDTKK